MKKIEGEVKESVGLNPVSQTYFDYENGSLFGQNDATNSLNL